MKKRLLFIFITVIILLPFMLSASAISDDEALIRKRAYYAGIESSLSLLSKNLGTLENVQIQKIVVDSPKDFITEDDVKEFVVAQSQKFLSHAGVRVFVQFLASENGVQQNYLFNHFLSIGSTYDIAPLTAPEQSETGSGQSVYYFALDRLNPNNDRLVAPGLANYGNYYYLDIDLSDYQNTGHSLSVPFQQADDSSAALFPLIRKRAYYRNIEQGLSLLERTHTLYGLSSIQIKRIIVTSSSDCTSEADVDKVLETYEQGRFQLTPIKISILYSASNGISTQDRVFDYNPSSPSTFSPFSFSSSPDDISLALTSFYNHASYFNNYDSCLAPGIAYAKIFETYYLDIDLSDYQAQGHSLLIAD